MFAVFDMDAFYARNMGPSRLPFVFIALYNLWLEYSSSCTTLTSSFNTYNVKVSIVVYNSRLANASHCCLFGIFNVGIYINLLSNRKHYVVGIQTTEMSYIWLAENIVLFRKPSHLSHISLINVRFDWQLSQHMAGRRTVCIEKA